ncbi:MAG: phosphoenolpyruvate carboxylase, partial [Myxococcota bacterium]
ESGMAASRWALYRAQQDLIATVGQCDENITLRLFHGRGGSIGRGGGMPRRAILAEPQGSINGHLRVTEQGEIIAKKYGLADIAVRTLEGVLGAIVQHTAGNEAVEPFPEIWSRTAQCIAEHSRQAYRHMVWENPTFIHYFRNATPIDVIERLKIGSRPASRRSQEGLEGLRAIPWVFAWTQSRHLLPSWFGVGTGLEAAIKAENLQTLQKMAVDWPFFNTLLANVEMVLAKADMQIAAHYAALAGETGQPIFNAINEEFARTHDLVCSILQSDNLLAADPVLRRAILLRNPYVDPMSLLQVDLLRRWRAGDRQDTELQRALEMTVRGIARGMQNTG